MPNGEGASPVFRGGKGVQSFHCIKMVVTMNRYGHPHKELLERLERVGSCIFITRDSGAVTVVTDGKQMRVFEYLSRKV